MPVVSLQLDAATNTAHVRMRGDVRATDVLATINTLYHEPRFDRGMKVFFDMRQARVAMSPQEVREVVTFASAQRDRRPGGRVAVVTDRDADYGMVRIAQVYLEEVQIELMVFRVAEEAKQWLEGEGDYQPQWPRKRAVSDEGEKAG